MDELKLVEDNHVVDHFLESRYPLLTREIPDLTAPMERTLCQCGKPLTYEWMMRRKPLEEARCRFCGYIVFEGEPLEPTEADNDFVASGMFFRQRFYHITSRLHWLSDILRASSGEAGDLLVHAGDRPTALYRGTSVRERAVSRGATEIYLHSFELTEEARDSYVPRILGDLNLYWPESTKPLLQRSDGLVRFYREAPDGATHANMGELSDRLPQKLVGAYVNDYELIGSLSIILNARAIEESSVDTEVLSW